MRVRYNIIHKQDVADKAAAALDEAGVAFKKVGTKLKTLDVRILAVAVAFGIIFLLAFWCVHVGHFLSFLSHIIHIYACTHILRI